MVDNRALTVRELGEFAVIQRMTRGRVQPMSVLVGPGDDAAVVTATTGRVVLSTDMLVQDRHFRLDWLSPAQIGSKAIAQNAADVVAMGVCPSAFLVSLGLPADTTVGFVDELVDGMWAETDRCGGGIAGGDLVQAPLVVISVTALGDSGRQPVITRTGAAPGDTVAVAGRLGWSAAGLAVLAGGDPERFSDVVVAHQQPHPPYDAVWNLPEGVTVSAMIDVSDGLLGDLGHLAASSGVAVDLSAQALRDDGLLPVAHALHMDPMHWILTGGEDHAFVATFATAEVPAGFRKIGRVGRGSGVTVDGAHYGGPGGWESFTAGG